MLTWLILVSLAAALVLFVLHRRNRSLGGLPAGELLAADNEEQECAVLISHRFGLKGKPDALVRTISGAIIPVERKRSSAPPRGPYDSDLIQAVVYGMLVEDEYGQPPPFVRIQYSNRWFDEAYTPERKQWVLRVSPRLRVARRASDCDRSHRMPAKCRNCGQKDNCGQAL